MTGSAARVRKHLNRLRVGRRDRDKFPNWRIESERLAGLIWDGFRDELHARPYRDLLAKRGELQRRIEQSFTNDVMLGDALQELTSQEKLAKSILQSYKRSELVSNIDQGKFVNNSDLFPVLEPYDDEPTVGDFCDGLSDQAWKENLKKQLSAIRKERETLLFRLSILESIIEYESCFGSPPSWDSLQKNLQKSPFAHETEQKAHEKTISIGRLLFK